VKADFINPFLLATKNVIETMAATKVNPGKPEVKKGKTTWGAVTGIIGMASSNVKGCMLVSFDGKTILTITNRMLSENFTELNKDVIDCVGELTNMICGGAKQKLDELGISFDMATPVTISGHNIEIHQISEGPTITIPFETDAGRFVIEANLHEKKK
jgi:chemotaxis protein CheX